MLLHSEYVHSIGVLDGIAQLLCVLHNSNLTKFAEEHCTHCHDWARVCRGIFGVPHLPAQPNYISKFEIEG